MVSTPGRNRGWVGLPFLGHVPEHVPWYVSRHLLKHVPEYVLKHVSTRFPEHVLKRMAHAILMT